MENPFFFKKETILLNKRGYYPLGELQIIIKDVFGLFTFKKSVKSNISLLVYPEINPLHTLKITANYKSGELLTSNPLFQDKSRISTIRNYRLGDPTNIIHWKLTAKGDDILVKEFEYRVDTNMHIFLDNYHEYFKGDYDRFLEDKCVDIALSIIDYCLNHGIEILLETLNEGRYIKLKGDKSSQLKPFLEELTRFSGNGQHKVHDLILPQINLLKKDSTIIIISPNLDKSLGAIGMDLKMKDLKPVFIIVSHIEGGLVNIDIPLENRLIKENIPLYVIDYKTSINNILEV